MAIPDSPNWSNITTVGYYPEPSFPLPTLREGVVSYSLGPSSLNNSQGKLTSRYWMCYQENGFIKIVGSLAGGVWSNTVTTLIAEATPIEEIALTFDQLGGPLVFYRVAEDTLRLYWYDPILQAYTKTDLAVGTNPLACFDFPQDTNQSFSDAILFYVRYDTIMMRVQRDRFSVEYDTGTSAPKLTLVSAGLRGDNRLQVVWSSR